MTEMPIEFFFSLATTKIQVAKKKENVALRWTKKSAKGSFLLARPIYFLLNKIVQNSYDSVNTSKSPQQTIHEIRRIVYYILFAFVLR